MKFIATIFFTFILCSWSMLACASPSRIYAALVGADGSVLTKGFEVTASAASVQENPRVAYFKGTFLVVWQDFRNGTDNDVYAVRISTDGKVLDETPIAIATGARTQAMPDVDADDEGFMVVYHGFKSTDMFPHVFAVRVRTDGSVRTPVALANGADPRIAWNGTSHFVVFTGLHTVYVAPETKWLRIDSDANVLSQAGKGFIWAPGGGPSHYSPCAMPQTAKGWVFVTHEDGPSLWGGMGAERVINITTDGIIEPTSPTAESGDVHRSSQTSNTCG